jgi:crossover junction endodeoxyribonuclease RuvC
MIIAVDPGLSGGIGVLTRNGGYIAAYPMPVKQKSAEKREMDASGILDLLAKHVSEKPIIVLERQRPFPKQSVTSAFSLGDSTGVIRGICAALGLAMERIEPQQWKRYYKLPGGAKGKAQSRGRAIDLFPMAPLQLAKDEGVAEALLIARWYAMTRGGAG